MTQAGVAREVISHAGNIDGDVGGVDRHGAHVCNLSPL